MRHARRKIASAALAASLVMAAPVHARAQAPDASTQEAVARTRFEKGRALFFAKKFEPALAEFRAASSLYESPNTRLYIARCEGALGHVAAAYVEFQRAASEAANRSATDPRYANTHSVAAAEARALESKIARVKVTAPDGLPPGATLTLNGADIGAAGVGVSAPVDPGEIEVVAKAPGYVAETKRTTAAAGESVEIAVRLAKAAPAPEPAPLAVHPVPDDGDLRASTPPPLVDATPRASHGLRNAGFVIGGLGIAGMAVFASFAALAQTRFDQLKSDCGGGPCDPTDDARIDEGQTFQNVANVALAASGTALLTGAIMVIAGISTEHKAPSVTASVAPLAGGGFTVGFGHAF